MSLSKILHSMKDKRVIAIDPASKSLAWSVLVSDGNNISVIAYGKIDLSKSSSISLKFEKIKEQLTDVLEEHKPQDGVIEQTVYIQNFQSSRILSYMVGFIWGVLDDHCNYVEDVNPLQWKSGIGYKNISAKDKAEIKKRCGGVSLQKELKMERKNRVKAIVSSELGFECDDDDINDSVGIGLWYCRNTGVKGQNA